MGGVRKTDFCIGWHILLLEFSTWAEMEDKLGHTTAKGERVDTRRVKGDSDSRWLLLLFLNL